MKSDADEYSKKLKLRQFEPEVLGGNCTKKGRGLLIKKWLALKERLRQPKNSKSIHISWKETMVLWKRNLVDICLEGTDKRSCVCVCVRACVCARTCVHLLYVYQVPSPWGFTLWLHHLNDAPPPPGDPTGALCIVGNPQARQRAIGGTNFRQWVWIASGFTSFTLYSLSHLHHNTAQF